MTLLSFRPAAAICAAATRTQAKNSAAFKALPPLEKAIASAIDFYDK